MPCHPRLFMLLLTLVLPAIPEAATPLAPAARDRDEQLHPDCVHGDDGYLVVWQEGEDYLDTAGSDLYLARIDTHGKPRPREVLADGDTIQARPRLAWNGTHYLAVWQAAGDAGDWDVLAARIAADGRVLDPAGIPLASGPDNQALPVVSPTAAGFLVVWQALDTDGFYRLQTTEVGNDGRAGEAGFIPYTGPDRPGLWGYTPGWGYKIRPLRAGGETPRLLTGGQPELVRAGPAQLLTWVDESNWGVGKDGIVTRRFARLVREDGRWRAERIQRAPNPTLGADGGRFAAGPDGRVLYTGWGVVGRGQLPGTAALLDAGVPDFLPNPNEPVKRHISGWTTQRMLGLFMPGAPVTGSFGAASGHGGYLVAAPALTDKDAELPDRILGARLDAGGRRLDSPPRWPVLHDGDGPLGNVALAAGERGFLLVFEEENNNGRRRLQLELLPAAIMKD